MTIRRPRSSLSGGTVWLPALIGAFMLPVITILPSGAIGLAARFIFAGVTAVLVFRSGVIGSALSRSLVLVVGVVFYGIALISMIWSGFWPITLIKAGLGFAILAGGGFLGWIVGRDVSKGSELIPFAILGVCWIVLTGAAIAMGHAFHPIIGLLQGPCGNPNMFASVTAFLALPTALAFRRAKMRSLRLMADVGWVVAGAAIVASGSRGALLVWLSAVAFSSVGLTLGRTSGRAVLVSAILIVSAYLAGVRFVESRIDEILYKADVIDAESDVFYSRRGPWELAAESARRAGMLGAGFGMFPGEKPEALSWLTTVGYGFESGSGWYSVRMQLGYPGLAAYVLLGVALLVGALGQFRRRRHRKEAAFSWTFLGIAIGLYVLSYFEAWIVSPGAPESVFFWSSVGTWSGLREAEQLKQVRQSIARADVRLPSSSLNPITGTR